MSAFQMCALCYGLRDARTPTSSTPPISASFTFDAAPTSSRLAGVLQMTCFVPALVACAPRLLLQTYLRRRPSPAGALCGSPQAFPPDLVAASASATVGVVVTATAPAPPPPPPRSRTPEAAPFTCRICKATVAGGTNGPAACARHPGPWLGAENGKLTGTGPADPALVRGVSYFWDCCGGEREDPPCALGWHEPYR